VTALQDCAEDECMKIGAMAKSVKDLNTTLKLKIIRLANMEECYILKIAFCEATPAGGIDGYNDLDVSTRLPDTIRQKYIQAVASRKVLMDEYLNNKKGEDLNDGESMCQPDAGFDLFVPDNWIRDYANHFKIDYKIKCAMFFRGEPVGYNLYARSSTGSKTPYRLANSVGIIDAAYRGNCISMFDNLRDTIGNKLGPDELQERSHQWEIKMGDRLVQICAPNITYPLCVEIVNVSELGVTKRNNHGFGSTGR